MTTRGSHAWWLQLLLRAAAEQPYHKRNDRPAPWRCDEPANRANRTLCFAFDSRDDGTTPDVMLMNMDAEDIQNRSCCGREPPACTATYPLERLRTRVPFGTPPACVKLQFKCCLDYWMKRFRLDEAYARAPPHVRCDSKFWDVYDIKADDVIFDQRSLMKLAAAFSPWIFVPYEAERMPELNGTNRDYVIVSKLGFGWFDADKAKPDALVLAQNLLRNPARPRRHAYALPRGVKDVKAWKDRCADNARPDRVRCAGMRLHRDRARKIQALRKNGLCELTARATGRHSGILKGAGYVGALSAARYAFSPPGVGFANYRDTEAIVAGAVPILERPKWPPQRGPFGDLHDEVPHVRVKDGGAWAALANQHLPSHRPAGDARKHYLPYWLYFILKRLLAANVTEATIMEPRAEKVEAENLHTSCRWAAIGAPWDRLVVNMGPFQNAGRRRIAKPRAWGGEGAWRRKTGRPSGAAY